MNLEEISMALVDLDEGIGSLVQTSLDAGIDPHAILKALTDGMDQVGEKYEAGEYFLSELVLAGETMKDAFEVLKPHLTTTAGKQKGPVVLATVEGDNHDIGKNILSSMLLSAGIEVIDLGVDCSAEEIVSAVKEYSAKVLGLSSLLTTTMKEIAVVNEALKNAGIRESVKLIVGGAPLTMDLAREYGADDYGLDAIVGVRKIRDFLSDSR
ncbi:MAG: corrinoid protein [Candidatus Thorarchaeota archaeon]